jgi:hypothetical protein
MVYQRTLGVFRFPTQAADPNVTWLVSAANPTLLIVTAVADGPLTTAPGRLRYVPISQPPVLLGASDGVPVNAFDVTLPF